MCATLMGRIGSRAAAACVLVLLVSALIFSLTAAIVPGAVIGAGGSAIANFVP